MLIDDLGGNVRNVRLALAERLWRPWASPGPWCCARAGRCAADVLRAHPYAEEGDYAHWGSDVYQSFQLMAAGGPPCRRAHGAIGLAQRGGGAALEIRAPRRIVAHGARMGHEPAAGTCPLRAMSMRAP